MQKSSLYRLFFLNLKWIYSLLFLLLSLQSYAGACNCICCRCDNRICGGRVAAGQKIYSPMTYSDTKLLNLKPNAEKSVVAASVAATNAAITITQADYQNIAQNGNSWIDFSNSDASFSMNIGTADNSNPQTFTLPSNLLTYFNTYGRLDFINESSLDAGLQIAGSDVAARKMLIDQDENSIYKYFHVDIANDGVYILGTSWDMYDEADDNFDEEADYEFLDAPLALNDVITSTIEEKNYDNNVCLTQEKETKTVDGYGSLILPNGSSVACLRISITVERRTRTLAQATNDDPFPTNPTETKNAIAFVTKQGHYFQALTSATSGTVTLTLPTYRFVQPTNSLEENNSVTINNNSKGITINTTDVTAHHSAILDVQSDSLGVLIPRITKVNRPQSPALGLLVYQIDQTPGFYYYNGTAWRILSSSASARMAAEENSQTGIDQLISGSKFVKFENQQDNPENLIIQIQPEGDCNGIFISQKTKEGFWVKELQKGKSNVKFSWKISYQ